MEKTGFDCTAVMETGGDSLKVWVDFNDQLKVLINYIPRKRISEIVKQSTRTTFQNHQRVEDYDNIKFGELLGVEAVADWDGPLANGEPIPCTPENIKKFMRNWTDFAKFISTVSIDLEQLVAQEKENARKNSGSSSGQGPTIQA